jgi:hypothetical protein
MGEAIKWVASRTSPLVGFCVVVFAVFLIALIAAAPLAARILHWLRGGPRNQAGT